MHGSALMSLLSVSCITAHAHTPMSCLRLANNMSASAQIAKLQDQGDAYTRKIEVEKRRIEELDKQIKKMQATILLQRKVSTGGCAYTDGGG